MPSHASAEHQQSLLPAKKAAKGPAKTGSIAVWNRLLAAPLFQARCKVVLYDTTSPDG